MVLNVAMFSLAAIDDDLVNGAGRLLVAGGLALTGLAAVAWQWPKIRHTTLVAPWIWALGTLIALVGVEIAIAVSGTSAPAWPAALRFAAAMSTFCPTMALLGAKRPQDRAWQLIVLSLWGILSLPSVEWLLYGGMSEIHTARFWFAMILLATGVFNALGTRYWPSSLLYGSGQVILLWPFFFAEPVFDGALAPLVGTSALVLALLLIVAGFPPARRAKLPLDRVWLDFRDAFGVVWALRVAERMNASARMYDWPVTLGWSGFHPREANSEVAMPHAVEVGLRTLLRRFVSPEWIDARLGDLPGEAPGATVEAP